MLIASMLSVLQLCLPFVWQGAFDLFEKLTSDLDGISSGSIVKILILKFEGCSYLCSLHLGLTFC